MKRCFLFLILIISSFIIGYKNDYVYASNSTLINVMEITTESEECGAFGNPNTNGTFAYYMQKVFDIMKFAGIVIAIIMSIKDILIAVADQKMELYKKLISKTIKRVIYAVLIFFLPVFLNLLFSIVGLYGTCGIV